MLHNSILIFTDGSSRGNPGPGGFGAIVIAPKNYESPAVEKSEFLTTGQAGIMNYEVREIGGREEHTTNNRMELRASIEALRLLQSQIFNFPTGAATASIGEQFSIFNITVYSDSSYLINGITKWVFGWQKNGWVTGEKKPVENRDLWEKLFSLSKGLKISWQKVGGHIGVVGNERCDIIAQTYAEFTQTDAERKLQLYNGPLKDYPIKNIFDISSSVPSEDRKKDSHSRAKQKAFSYVSRVDGKIQTHKTWAECERRVKGRSGALFKKSISAKDEGEIIASWRK
jgi:ribonuclease HI